MNAFFAMTGRSTGFHPLPPPPVPTFDVSWLNGGLLAGAGDSLTRGVGSTFNANGYLPQIKVVLASLGCTVDIYNGGVDSATTGGINANATANIDPLYDPMRPCVYLYEGGGNDIYFGGDAAVASSITGNWTGLDDRVSGWRKILIVSPDRGIDPTIGPPVETPAGQDRTEYRTSLTAMRSGLVSGYATHAEAIVMLQDNPLLVCTDFSVCNNDEVHWRDNGYGYWAAASPIIPGAVTNVLAVLGSMTA